MLAIFLCALAAAADVTSIYTGIATRDGKTIYIEKHEVVENDKGEVLRATTSYQRPDGQVMATLTSDFTASVTNAAHEMHDRRDDHRYGVRWKNGHSYMYDMPKGKKEKREKIDDNFADGKLVIGGQGLHYHMRSRLEEFRKKRIPIAILIPGKLDWYSFLVEFDKEENGLLKYTMKAQSALLRLFAPKLEVWYSKEGKLQKYHGLSNLKDDKGGNQSVTITYSY